MLQLILGGAGSGKTTYIHKLAAEYASQKQETVLLVPEQFSFETERAVLEILGDSDAQYVKVFSFTRLAAHIAEEFGGTGTKLDDSGRAAVMSVVLSELGDRLNYYTGKRSSIQFIPHLIDAVKEFKICAVTPDMLEKASRNVRGTLAAKLSELALVSRAYDAVCERTALDPLQDLDILAERLDSSDFFRNATVMIDSFRSFTGQEHKIISKIIAQSKLCAITLCCNESQPTDEFSLFSTVEKTAARLMQTARDHSVSIAPHVRLTPGVRFTSQAIGAVEQGVYRYDEDNSPYMEDTGDVRIYAAANRNDEAEFCARECRRLLREEGYRCREIAVIARSSDKYAEMISDAFDRQDVDCFIDLRTPVESSALMRFIFSALSVVSGGWQLEDILKMLKCGMIEPISWDDVCMLENYCLIWNLRGRDFKKQFSANPSGFARSMDENDQLRLDELNRIRKTVCGLLTDFDNRLRSAGGRDMAAAIFNLLVDADSSGAIAGLRQRLAPALADDSVRIWNILINLLDQLAGILGQSRISVRDFSELLLLMTRASSLGHIPQKLDQVTFGSADRVRLSELRAVFIIGVLDGEFPSAPNSTAVFSDDERRLLCSLGVPITEPSEQQLLDERLLAYSAVCSASERLYLTYPVGSYNPADKLSVSRPGLISEVLRCVPNAMFTTSQSINAADTLEGKEAAFDIYARNAAEDSEFTASLRHILSQDAEYSGRVELIEAAAAGAAPRVRSKALCSGDRPLYLSASSIESFYRCRFEYFCKYCLRIYPRRKAEIDSLQYGSAIHYVLEHLLSSLGKDAFVRMAESDALEQSVEALLEQYLRQELGDESERDGRFKFMWSALCRTVCAAVKNIARELADSDFTPVAFELEIGPHGDIIPAELTMPDGTRIIIDGFVDRVDVYEDGERKYLRVIDYKSGKKTFRLSEILNGMNAQMLLYLRHLCSDGSKYSQYTPAGVMYCPTGSTGLKMHRGATANEITEASDSNRKRSGLVIDDTSDFVVVNAMEHEGAGKFIPVKLVTDKTSGELKVEYHTKDKVISSGQFGVISKFIDKLMTDMCAALAEGIIAPSPVAKGSWTSCQHCDYRAICRYEGECEAMLKADTQKSIDEMTVRLEGADNNA